MKVSLMMSLAASVMTSSAAIAVDDRGRVRCRHGLANFSSAEHPTREGIHPGQPTDVGAHRVRVRCPTGGCGKLAVRMKEHWRRLLDYPLYPQGRPDLFAMRIVLIARLAQVESLFSRFKQRGLANPGATRPHTVDLSEQEAYMALCAASFTALTLADQRQRRGIALAPLPGGLSPTSQPGDVSDQSDLQPAASVPAARPALRLIDGGRA
jgi:hypothetical protein